MSVLLSAMTQTWNNVATTFSAILMNVTDTASAAASRLLSLQVGGVDKFIVRKDGAIVSPGSTQIIEGASGQSVEVLVKTGDAGAANANATTTYRANAGIAGYCGRISSRFGLFNSSARPLITWGTGSPEGAVTADIGAQYNRLDGGAGTTLYMKESGANTNTGWVAK